MIVKNIKTNKYEIIKSDHSYYFNIIFSKYNINISAPLKETHILIKEKKSTMFTNNERGQDCEYNFVLKKVSKINIMRTSKKQKVFYQQ